MVPSKPGRDDPPPPASSPAWRSLGGGSAGRSLWGLGGACGGWAGVSTSSRPALARLLPSRLFKLGERYTLRLAPLHFWVWGAHLEPVRIVASVTLHVPVTPLHQCSQQLLHQRREQRSGAVSAHHVGTAHAGRGGCAAGAPPSMPSPPPPRSVALLQPFQEHPGALLSLRNGPETQLLLSRFVGRSVCCPGGVPDSGRLAVTLGSGPALLCLFPRLSRQGRCTYPYPGPCEGAARTHGDGPSPSLAALGLWLLGPQPGRLMLGGDCWPPGASTGLVGRAGSVPEALRPGCGWSLSGADAPEVVSLPGAHGGGEGCALPAAGTCVCANLIL